MRVKCQQLSAVVQYGLIKTTVIFNMLYVKHEHNTSNLSKILFIFI